MGMFDYIKCEYKLPLPELKEEHQKDFDEIDWEEIEFQTKSFDGAMSTYEITSDGQIYERILEREMIEDPESPMGIKVNETEGGIEKSDYSGEIEFYHLVTGEKLDYWLEFKALFWKGELKEMTLVEFKDEDNEGRRTAQDQFEKSFKKAQLRSKKWWFKVYHIYRVTLGFILGLIRKVFEWIVILLIKIERWMP